MGRILRSSNASLAVLLGCFGLLLATAARAEVDLRMSGLVTYGHTASTATMTVERIDNISVANGISVDARLELWAFRAPFTGINQVGYEQQGFLLATYDLGPLAFGYYFANVASGNVPFTRPPPGTYSITVMLTEYNGGNHNTFGFLPMDFVNFPNEVFTQALAAGDPAPPPTPQTGLWWNPSESGSGYALDVKNGTLVVTVYSYKPNGDSQWYMASGRLNGAKFTGTLDKYASGQCISCAYGGRPAMVGNDGTITIEFQSATSATVTLPGGRVTKIQPQVF